MGLKSEIFAHLAAKDQTGVTPKWIGLALELLLRAELARLAEAERQAGAGAGADRRAG